MKTASTDTAGAVTEKPTTAFAAAEPGRPGRAKMTLIVSIMVALFIVSIVAGVGCLMVINKIMPIREREGRRAFITRVQNSTTSRQQGSTYLRPGNETLLRCRHQLDCPPGAVCKLYELFAGYVCICRSTGLPGLNCNDSKYPTLECDSIAKNVGRAFGRHLIKISRDRPEQLRMAARLITLRKDDAFIWTDDEANVILLSAAVRFARKFPRAAERRSLKSQSFLHSISMQFGVPWLALRHMLEEAVIDPAVLQLRTRWLRRWLGVEVSTEWLEPALHDDSHRMSGITRSKMAAVVYYFLSGSSSSSSNNVVVATAGGDVGGSSGIGSSISCGVAWQLEETARFGGQSRFWACQPLAQQRLWVNMLDLQLPQMLLAVRELLWVREAQAVVPTSLATCVSRVLSHVKPPKVRSRRYRVLMTTVAKIDTCLARSPMLGSQLKRAGPLSNPFFTFYNYLSGILDSVDPVRLDGQPSDASRLNAEPGHEFNVNDEIASYLKLIRQGRLSGVNLLGSHVAFADASWGGYHPLPLLNFGDEPLVFPEGLLYVGLRLALVVVLKDYRPSRRGLHYVGESLTNDLRADNDLSLSTHDALKMTIQTVTTDLIAFHRRCLARAELSALTAYKAAQ